MSNPVAPGLLPLFAELRGRRVPVVGGGVLARRKVESLLAARADGVVGAPVLEPALAAWKAEARIEHRAGSFAPHWLDDAGPPSPLPTMRRPTVPWSTPPMHTACVGMRWTMPDRRASTPPPASNAARCRSRSPAAAARRCGRASLANNSKSSPTNPSPRWLGRPARACAFAPDTRRPCWWSAGSRPEPTRWHRFGRGPLTSMAAASPSLAAAA